MKDGGEDQIRLVLLYIFWPHNTTCWILVPWIRDWTQAVSSEVQSPNHQTIRGFPDQLATQSTITPDLVKIIYNGFYVNLRF